jgi:hypothetical protein
MNVYEYLRIGYKINDGEEKQTIPKEKRYWVTNMENLEAENKFLPYSNKSIAVKVAPFYEKHPALYE